MYVTRIEYISATCEGQSSLSCLKQSEQHRPVSVTYNPVHKVEVHQAKARHRGTQVKVDDILLADPPQGLAVAHPGQSVHDLLIPR